MKEALDVLLEHVDIGQGEEIDERRVLRERYAALLR